jgi:hypothetical protein
MELRDDNQAETLSAEDQAVRSLVGSLTHVEAPANFERRVMSAISSRKATGRPFAFVFVAYAIPAVLVLLIAAFLVFRQPSPRPMVDQPAIAKQDVQAAPPPTAAAVERPAATDPTLAAQSDRLTEPQPQATQPKRNVARPTDVKVQPGGGSFDEGQKQTRAPLPQGITVPRSPNAPNPDDVMTHVAIPVSEVLGQIGIKANRADGWHVTSVMPNSPAAHTGIQVGDVVLSLGDQDIQARDDFESGGSVGSIKLRRAGKVLVLPLKN